MATELTAATGGEIMEQVLLKGDLSKLTPEERASYYMKVCESVGFNPLTRPLEYITLNGKLTLYARKDATDQLRRLRGVSLTIIERAIQDDVMIVRVHAKTQDGREDEDCGAVAMLYPEKIKDRNGNWSVHPKAGKPLEGDDRANAVLKAVTKAKRRVTLSISGMGFLDETEVEDIPAEAKQPKDVTPKPTASGFRIAPKMGGTDAVPESAPRRMEPVGATPTPPPSDDVIHADDPFAQPVPQPSTLDTMIAEIDALSEKDATDGEFVEWWEDHKPAIRKLTQKENGELRIHFTAARAQARGQTSPAAAAGAA